jgi:hypothetical protein
MTLTLELEPELYFALEDYRDCINRKTGNDLTRSEAAVALLEQLLREKGLLQ